MLSFIEKSSSALPGEAPACPEAGERKAAGRRGWALLDGPLRWWLFLGLTVLLGWLIYHPVGHFEFLNFDDDIYLSNNPWMKRGLTGESLRWAFGANLTEFSQRAEYWSPITLLSRLADAQIHGLNAGAFHVTSALLHVLNAALLCAALSALTGKWKRSAVVALIFLVHPLNVEPVGWLSARKDLLSATFFFCTLLAYAHYVKRQTGGRYALLLLAFCGGLMSKPMGVTTPLILLVLDGWPLGRWAQAAGRREEQIRLIAEKLPLLLLAIGGAVLAVVSQHDWGALQSAGLYPLPVRIENALLSYALYVRRVFWPSDLAIYYPHPGLGLPLWQAGLALLFLCVATVGAWGLRKRAPFALAGWLWFGLALGPVIGLVQIGNQAMADRYAYPSVIGIFVAVVWGAAELLRKRPAAGALGGIVVLGLFTAVSMRQVLFWRDSEAAFSHALEVTRNNDLAYFNLACAEVAKGDLEKAREHYLLSLKIRQRSAIWNDLAVLEETLGHEDAAAADYQVALRLDAGNGMSLLHLGMLLRKRGEKQAAEALLLRVNQAEPAWSEPYRQLGGLYAGEARWSEAAQVWSAYLRMYPDDAAARAALSAAQAARR
jgi:Tfp pilus assembly protein PilF